MEVIIAGSILILILAAVLAYFVVYGFLRFKNLFLSRKIEKRDLTYTMSRK